jgi:hypothetical protein
MRTIKPYFKGAPFYNAFIRPYPVQVEITSGCHVISQELGGCNPSEQRKRQIN